MDPASAGALANSSTNGAAYLVEPTMYASFTPNMMTTTLAAVPARAPPSAVHIEAARRRQEEEEIAIRLVNLLVTSAGAIQAGDYAAAAGTLGNARELLCKISTVSGIGRLMVHFADALTERLFPAFPQSSPPPPCADQRELFRHFYEAGPYLKFAHFAANQAILEAFEGCNHVHVIDFALMDGVQWPSLIQALAVRPGGPPTVRITGIGPRFVCDRDVLRDVGVRLAEFASSVNVPFSFRGVASNNLDDLSSWMFQLSPGETVAVNSILQLHRLLVDQDAASTSSPPPIDVVLTLVASINPKIFTVVEQEADHNKSSLLERFTNSLFYYGGMFDSMEAVNLHAGGDRVGYKFAEAYLQGEISDIVSREGSSRLERHEPTPRWRDRLQRAGLTQLPLGRTALWQATMQLRKFFGAGYFVQENGGFLTLAWNNRLLYSASAWRVTVGRTTMMLAGGAAMEDGDHTNNSGGESSGHGVVIPIMQGE
ncbi:hypothetical protein GUJ93_ZPchr0005g14874 [Zizania palustris]|uniref:Uncharacterized protein n=1 Tax=Zizania palustris TaxID=103762 RepID=A0A8J5S5H6_ZIZPA|nr:hypothetical protein GUJ93_ZPchr0005g14874 [Zizania palustris]